MVGFVRTLNRQVKVFRLFFRQMRQLDAKVFEMQAGHLFIEFLGQDIDLLLILALVRP